MSPARCVRSIVALTLLVSFAVARPPMPDAATQAHVRAVADAQADLDAGRVTDARRKLDATEKALRSFEYDYLLARAAAAPANGPAPDLIKTIAKPEAVETRYACLDPHGRQLAFICRDGAMRVHDLTTPVAPPHVTPETAGNATWAGVFSHDGSAFVSGHENGDVVVWDAKTWKVRHRLPVAEGRPVRELAVAPDGSAVVAEGKTQLELWSLAGKEPKKLADVGERYNFGEGLAYSPKGDEVATGGMFEILVHDAKTGKQLRAMRHASYTMGIEFSPDGKRIASAPRGNVNKFLAVFDAAGGRPRFNAGPFDNYVAGMAFTPDGRRIAATGCEKVLRLFDAATGEVALALPRPECGAKPAVTRDGRVLGWSEPDGYKLIDLGKPAGSR
jgi:WD40 repeat protein